MIKTDAIIISKIGFNSKIFTLKGLISSSEAKLFISEEKSLINALQSPDKALDIVS
jgi:hypothetical protein